MYSLEIERTAPDELAVSILDHTGQGAPCIFASRIMPRGDAPDLDALLGAANLYNLKINGTPGGDSTAAGPLEIRAWIWPHTPPAVTVLLKDCALTPTRPALVAIVPEKLLAAAGGVDAVVLILSLLEERYPVEIENFELTTGALLLQITMRL